MHETEMHTSEDDLDYSFPPLPASGPRHHAVILSEELADAAYSSTLDKKSELLEGRVTEFEAATATFVLMLDTDEIGYLSSWDVPDSIVDQLPVGTIVTAGVDRRERGKDGVRWVVLRDPVSIIK
jgi:hypothetical protein